MENSGATFKTGGESSDVGDIVTTKRYRNFDLRFDRSGGPVETGQRGQQWREILY